MPNTYDVIVVGAGPGGAMAACTLGQAGCRVLVLERQEWPRYKPCGGAIPAQVFAALPPACSRAIERRVTRVRFRLGDEEVTHRLDGWVAMVMRDRFDAALLAEAQAEVHTGEGVTALMEGRQGVEVRTGHGRYWADYVVGADGAFSVVARAVGLRRGHLAGAAMEAEVAAPAALLDEHAETALFLFGAIPDGYLWAFPKADHLSVGIGTLRAGRHDLRRRLVEGAQRLRLPAGQLRPRGHALPAYRRREPLQRGRVLLVGDAAGLMDPLSGEGIRHALHSGRLAAEAILSGGVAAYSQQVHQEIGADLGAGLWLARAFYAFPRLSFRLAVRDRSIVAAMMRMLSGQTTYRALLRGLLGHYLRRRPLGRGESLFR